MARRLIGLVRNGAGGFLVVSERGRGCTPCPGAQIRVPSSIANPLPWLLYLSGVMAHRPRRLEVCRECRGSRAARPPLSHPFLSLSRRLRCPVEPISKSSQFYRILQLPAVFPLPLPRFGPETVFGDLASFHFGARPAGSPLEVCKSDPRSPFTPPRVAWLRFFRSARSRHQCYDIPGVLAACACGSQVSEPIRLAPRRGLVDHNHSGWMR